MRRVAVVTGAAGAIGSATCELLDRHGWEIVGVDLRPTGLPNEITLDLADHGAVMARLGAIERVDALVNNAALQLFKPLADTTVEEWDAVVAVNLRGAFVSLKAVQPQLTAAAGAVVNVGSVHALATSRSISAYAASKGGLAAFTRAAALELAPAVRVNAVVPGAVESPALREGFSRRDGAERELVERTPLGRVGEPGDIAEAVAFLIDAERSAFVTGQQIVVDGGALARLSTE
jgi:NAD(P)-dependent dehydrogenase (short-subunit alcohol dehydrogenase family)